jgi:hypothetical protein
LANIRCCFSRERLDEIIAGQQASRYFLMSRVYAPSYSRLIRTNGNDSRLIRQDMTGELGMFGSVISQQGRIVSERIGGCLLRSKPTRCVEGGIASGQGCIDSIVLV